MKTTTVITFLSLASLLSLGWWSAPASAEKPAKPTAVANSSSSSTATATNTNIVNVITPPAQSQSFAGQSPSFDLVRAGVSVFTSLINPPHRADEIRAEGEVKKAKINAQMELDREKMRIEASRSIDRAAPVLVQWGATRVPCTPGVVFVNGITADTVCINPSNSIPSGYYSYSAGNNLLVRAPENRPARPAEANPSIPTAPASAYASISNKGF
jgi:hypothetical protein